MSLDQILLKKRLNGEEYLLNGMKPSSAGYQTQFEKVKQLRTELQLLVINEKDNKEGSNTPDAQ
ncbi:hypothetical protein QG516_25760 [Pedobacter gandavensis]|uniref:hypothetical protein n=1 Tax=Pedobacter gandavensis TaxID=2679963 RepID=UPI002478D958|nr:hypothetical protein [Pedobacter gandavensis]WGQ09923.1 hypothetical protein QG516_25760 [Pedobacter gandavensis]